MPHTRPPPAATFVDPSRIDAMLADVVPDAEDRAFVVRCIFNEGPPHHRGANYALLMLLGTLVDALGGADVASLRARGTVPVPMKVSPHLARPGSMMAYPLTLPTGPLEKLAPAGSPEQAAIAECLTDGPAHHALANAAMVWLIGAALERVQQRRRPSTIPPSSSGRRARPSSAPKR
jgi:hypothetical protein